MIGLVRLGNSSIAKSFQDSFPYVIPFYQKILLKQLVAHISMTVMDHPLRLVKPQQLLVLVTALPGRLLLLSSQKLRLTYDRFIDDLHFQVEEGSEDLAETGFQISICHLKITVHPINLVNHLSLVVYDSLLDCEHPVFLISFGYELDLIIGRLCSRASHHLVLQEDVQVDLEFLIHHLGKDVSYDQQDATIDQQTTYEVPTITTAASIHCCECLFLLQVIGSWIMFLLIDGLLKTRTA